MSTAVKVDVWSDIACPWCFIGKRKFEAGAVEFGGEVKVRHHSFELSPDTPVDFDGSKQDYLVTRGFPADQITVLGHQLIHYAKAYGRQLEMKERLLAAYFEEGKHVGRVEDLADLAAELGFDRDDVVRSLNSIEYLADVKADQALAIEYGIQGVPFFVIDDRCGVSGAQEIRGDADAASCEGEFCELPAHREQAVINRRIDADLI